MTQIITHQKNMKMSKLLSKSFMILLIGVAIVSCEKDPPEAPPVIDPEDLVISIGENSSFNQRNFKVSFEQLFFGVLWTYDFSHQTNANLVLLNSDANCTVFGKLGEDVISYKHIYHELGFITHSIQSFADPQNGSDLILEYEYDQIGLITRMIQRYGEEIKYVIDIEYNSQMQLIHKTYFNEGEMQRSENYEYNSNGKVSVLEQLSESYQFVYSDDLLIEIKLIQENEDDESYFIEYDAMDRISLVNIYNHIEVKVLYEEVQFLMEAYEDNQLTSITTHEQGMFVRKYTELKYLDNEFDFAVEKEFDDNGRPIKKYYYTGEVTQFELGAYSLIETINQDDFQNRKESYISSEDELIGYCQFKLVERFENGGFGRTLTNFQWFLADGSEISGPSVLEPWIMNMEVY